MKKIIFLLLLLIILSVYGCTEKGIDPYYVYNCLLENVSYDSELSDVGDSVEYIFYGIPENSEVFLYRATDAHFVDEVAVIIAPDLTSSSDIIESINTHIEEVYNDYSKYNPSELFKIDNAIIKTYQNYAFLCITGDYENAQTVLDEAIKNSPQEFEHNFNEKENSEEFISSGITSSEEINNSSEQYVQVEPEYPSIISKSGEVFTYENNVIRVDNAAYEPYKFFSDVSKNYATIINNISAQIKGESNVYVIPIPNAYGIVLPDDIQIKLNYHNQGDAINKIKKFFNEDINIVDCYDNLMKHRDEYIYFRTDHHWTQLGAYYAYESFCKNKNIEYYSLENRKVSIFEGFLGSLYQRSSGKDPMLGNTPDTVFAYHPVSKNVNMSFTDVNGNTYAWDIIHDVTKYPASEKYNTFAASDSPFAVLKNYDLKDGSCCVVIKESYGNAFVPFLVDHYETIYEIDYRYWNGNLIDFLNEVNPDDVIFINNLSMIGSNYLISKLSALI